MAAPPSTSTALPVAIALGESAARAAAHSYAALDAPMTYTASLHVAAIADDAILLGAFGRAASLPAIAPGAPLYPRISGGPLVRIGAGSVHVVLTLASPAALTPCDPRKITNRYVRPLLRAITRFGVRANYFGRDWISVDHRPAAFCGFAHDARSQRAVFEAIVAVSAPFATGDRASYAGNSPATLEELRGAPIDRADFASAIADSYAAAYGCTRVDAEVAADAIAASAAPPIARDADPPWTAVRDEAIGLVAAGRDHGGRLVLGGDFMASRDAVRDVAARVDRLPPGASIDDVGAVVDAVFTAPGVALEGIRALTSIRDVLAEAR